MSTPVFIVISLIFFGILIYSFAFVKGKKELKDFVVGISIFIRWSISLLFYRYPLSTETGQGSSSAGPTIEEPSVELSSSETIMEETRAKRSEPSTTIEENAPKPSIQEPATEVADSAPVIETPSLEAPMPSSTDAGSGTLPAPLPEGYPSTGYEIQSGWEQDRYGDWRWRQVDGSYLRRGWVDSNGQWYYIDDGVMVIGWYEIQNKDYYFDDNGAMLKNVWVDDHFLSPSGYAYTDIEKVIDGIKYYFDMDGYATEIGDIEDDISDNDLGSELSFSDDFCLEVRQDGRDRFYLNGYVSSDHMLKRIAYEIYTPETNGTFGSHSYKSDGPYVYYLEDIGNMINENIIEYVGDYRLIITVTDSSGATISTELEWSYP